MIQPIEYIGPVPNKKKPKAKFGGWIMLLLVSLFVTNFAWPYIEGVAHASQDQPNTKLASALSGRLLNSHSTPQKIAGAALQRTQAEVTYDPVYHLIDYPMGDIPQHKGMHTDLIIRSLRVAGVDLQQLIHEDMETSFSSYPQLWSLKEPDSNIDHRRIENINRYLTRHHSSHETSRNPADYQIGNIVIWRLPTGDLHIGIVVPGPGVHESEKWIAHNLNQSPTWEDSLFDYNIIGNYSLLNVTGE